MNFFMKKDNIKKIAIVILIFMCFNIIIPTYSSAVGIGVSLLSKPIATLVMHILDSINAMMSLTFAFDAKAKDFATDVTDIKQVYENGKEDFFEKFTQSLNEAEEAYFNLLLSPDDIFSNRVKIADANIFSEESNGVTELTGFGHLMKTLKEAVSGIYYIMRNLAVVILLCSLIYCGIRIVLSSNIPGEKSKWQTHLMDWLKSLVLVMFVHVILIGIFYIAEVVTEGIRSTMGKESIVTFIRKQFKGSSFFDITGVWIYVIMYGYITYMTVVFIIAYFKRLIYIMVLIMLAPIFGALYPLGKTTKENFSRFMREFVMGVMVQPFHMLIYYILVLLPLNLLDEGGVVEGAKWTLNFTTPDVQLYALMSIAMIRPIEKYLRKLFGFQGTTLDNMASFESGKQTLDKGIQMAEKIGKGIALAVAAVATGGAAAAAAPGVLAAEGGAMMAEGGAVAAATEGMTMTEGMNVLAGEDGAAEYAMTWGDGTFTEGTTTSMTPDMSPDMLPDTGEEDINNTNLRTGSNSNSESSADSKASAEENAEVTSGEEITLDSANVQINQADTMDISAVSTMSTDSINQNEVGTENIEDKTQDEQVMENFKDLLSESQLGKMFAGPLENLKNKKDELKEKAMENPFIKAVAPYLEAANSPYVKEKFEDVRQGTHEFVDTLYMGDASKDWQNDRKERIGKEKEELIYNFTNDPQNIERAIEKFALKDKKDSKTGEITSTATDQAKEKLKGMGEYVARGIKDIDIIAQLQAKGLQPDAAMKEFASTDMNGIKGTNRWNEFVQNKTYMQQMKVMVADDMGIPKEQRMDININQKVEQQVKQVLEENRRYITQGAAYNPDTLKRIIDLQRTTEKHMPTTMSNKEKQDFIMKFDKAINKAIKEGVSKMDIKGAPQISKIGTQQIADRTANRPNYL